MDRGPIRCSMSYPRPTPGLNYAPFQIFSAARTGATLAIFIGSHLPPSSAQREPPGREPMLNIFQNNFRFVFDIYFMTAGRIYMFERH
jgi:hypothetical protein